MVWVRIKPKLKIETLKAESHLTPALSPLLAASQRGEGENYPPSCTTKHFEWRANGRLSTIYGRHPKGMNYLFRDGSQ
jgi:prepilin-type processing-associated H-X9-DG protein